MVFSKEITARPTKEFADAVNRRKKAGKEILSFGLGEPDFKTPQYVVDAMFDAINDGYTHYCDAQGLAELREKISSYVSSEYDVTYTPSEVAVTPGIKSAAYSALAAILQPEDNVVLCTPCYVAYPAMIKMAEPKANIIEMDMDKDYSFDIKKLEDICKKGIKALIVNTPNNPSGMVFSEEEVEAIVAMSIEYDFWIVSDEVYDKIVFKGNEHKSFAEYSTIKNRLILVNGFSKSHAMTGWRLGYALVPEDVCYKIGRIQFNTNTNVATFIQKAACSIYEHDWDHIDRYTEELEERMAYFHNEINSIENLSGILPKGGFFYLVNISKTKMTSNAFAAKLVEETGIATTPGIAFGKNWDEYIRFSLAVPIENIQRAVGLIKDFMESNYA